MVPHAVTDHVATDAGGHSAALAEVERLFRAQLSPLRLFPGAVFAVRNERRADVLQGLLPLARGLICLGFLAPATV